MYWESRGMLHSKISKCLLSLKSKDKKALLQKGKILWVPLASPQSFPNTSRLLRGL